MLSIQDKASQEISQKSKQNRKSFIKKEKCLASNSHNIQCPKSMDKV